MLPTQAPVESQEANMQEGTAQIKTELSSGPPEQEVETRQTERLAVRTEQTL